MSEDVIGFTLWGDPVYRIKRKRGRPPFEWTEENSHKVSMLLALGWSNDRIASCILDPRTGKSISLPTLKRYFRSEMSARDEARDQMTARRIMVIARSAFDGNVGAMKLLDQMIEKNDRALAEASLGEAVRGERVPEAKRGKKEIKLMEAGEADASLQHALDLEAEKAVRAARAGNGVRH